MKKKWIGLLVGLLLVAIPCWATESVVEGQLQQSGKGIYEVAFVITTDASGDIAATTFSQSLINKIKGKYLLQVEAFPTPGGTAPDAADVIVKDENGIYVLGSVDDGVTAKNGLNLIHATIPKACLPAMYLTGTTAFVNYYWPIRGALTFDILNQGANSAQITLIFVFTD